MTFRNLKRLAQFQLIEDNTVMVKIGDRQAMKPNGQRVHVNPNEEIRLIRKAA